MRMIEVALYPEVRKYIVTVRCKNIIQGSEWKNSFAIVSNIQLLTLILMLLPTEDQPLKRKSHQQRKQVTASVQQQAPKEDDALLMSTVLWTV